MHEISLVRNVFNTLEAEFSKEELKELTAIHLKIGALSNVEPILMQNAFNAVTTAEEKFQQVQLHIQTIPIKIYCHHCKVHSLIQNYKFACASCGSPNNNVVEGTELLIHQVQFN